MIRNSSFFFSLPPLWLQGCHLWNLRYLYRPFNHLHFHHYKIFLSVSFRKSCLVFLSSVINTFLLPSSFGLLIVAVRVFSCVFSPLYALLTFVLVFAFSTACSSCSVLSLIPG
nr:MAG TPA: hypothetical protein [Bacteriophage sp.]